jgi:hypothetical protein
MNKAEVEKGLWQTISFVYTPTLLNSSFFALLIMNFLLQKATMLASSPSERSATKILATHEIHRSKIPRILHPYLQPGVLSILFGFEKKWQLAVLLQFLDHFNNDFETARRPRKNQDFFFSCALDEASRASRHPLFIQPGSCGRTEVSFLAVYPMGILYVSTRMPFPCMLPCLDLRRLFQGFVSERVQPLARYQVSILELGDLAVTWIWSTNGNTNPGAMHSIFSYLCAYQYYLTSHITTNLLV